MLKQNYLYRALLSLQSFYALTKLHWSGEAWLGVFIIMLLVSDISFIPDIFYGASSSPLLLSGKVI